jgi:hypothetical protein
MVGTGTVDDRNGSFGFIWSLLNPKTPCSNDFCLPQARYGLGMATKIVRITGFYQAHPKIKHR